MEPLTPPPPPRERRDKPPRAPLAREESNVDEFLVGTNEPVLESPRVRRRSLRRSFTQLMDGAIVDAQGMLAKGGGTLVADDDDIDELVEVYYQNDIEGLLSSSQTEAVKPRFGDVSLKTPVASPPHTRISNDHNGANDQEVYIPLLNGHPVSPPIGASTMRKRLRRWDATSPPQAKPIPGSGRAHTVVAYVKAMIGIYVLYLPHLFALGGAVYSSLILVSVCALSTIGMLLLLDCRALACSASYGDIGASVYGRTGRIAVNISLVLSQLGYCVTYFVFVTKNFAGIFGVSPIVATLAQLAFYAPLSCVRHLHFLGGALLIANLGLAIGLVMSLVTSFLKLAEDGIDDGISLFRPSNCIMIIGSFTSAFEGVGLIIPLQDAMIVSQRPDFPKLLCWCNAGVCSFFLLIALGSYLTFGPDVQTFIIMEMPQTSVAGLIARVAYGIGVMLTYPLQLFPAIKVLESLLLPVVSTQNDDWTYASHNSLHSSEHRRGGSVNCTVTWKRRLSKNLLRGCVVIFTAVLALGAEKVIDPVCGLIGAATLPLALVYPSLFHLKLSRRGMTTFRRVSETCMVILGILLTVLCSIMSLMNM